MATILTTVDKTSGNFQDVFIYTVNASFNGINEAIETARIELLFSKNLTVYLGDVESPFTSYTVVEDGDNYRYTFPMEEITDLGIAVRLGIGTEFNVGTPLDETFILNSFLYVNDELVTTHLADEISLNVVPDFRYDRDVILPTIDPTPGSAVFFKVALVNFGDLGASIDNVKFEVPSIDGITIDPDYVISGYDATTSAKFADTSLDGKTGTLIDNVITFDMSKYSGERYEFTYRCIISSDFSVGIKVPTTMNYYLDETFVETDTISITLGLSVYEMTSSVYGPTYSEPGANISYELNFQNTGNEIFEDLTFIDELSSEILYTGFYTGAFKISQTNQMLDTDYMITYVTVNGVTETLGPYNTDTNEYVPASLFVPAGDNIYSLTWDIGTFGLGCVTSVPPTINGVINEDVAIGRNLLNHLEYTYNADGTVTTVDKNHEASIEVTSSLAPIFTSSTNGIPKNPNTTLTYTLSASTRTSRLIDPILVALLPPELVYQGNEVFEFNGYFGEEGPSLIPEAYVEENFTSAGETLVKYEFKGDYSYTFDQKSTFSLSFDAKIESDATGSVSTYMLLNTATASSAVDPDSSIYRDTDNIADDTEISVEYAKTAEITNTILFFISVSSFKQVKGLLDEEFVSYPKTGSTIDGGDLTYTINVKNTGNSNLNYVKVVDVLPYFGDTGVILVDEPRESEFAVYLKSDVVARILPDNIIAPVIMSYSVSSNPLRFGPEFDLVGLDTATFTTEKPSDYTTIKTIKVETDNVILKPNQTLEVSFMASVPSGVEIGSTAWNSFAADIYYPNLDGVDTRLLGIEPVKSGITIAEPPVDTGTISGYAFLDKNGDGLCEDYELKMDDIGVGVFSLDGTLLASAYTTPDVEGNSGYYTISNLPLQECYIQFFIDTDVYRFTTQNTTAENGSVCDASGKTETFDLSATQVLSNMNIGFLTKTSAYDLDTILKVNKQARSMVRSTLYNQMLIGMKHEDVLDLARADNKKE